MSLAMPSPTAPKSSSVRRTRASAPPHRRSAAAASITATASGNGSDADILAPTDQLAQPAGRRAACSGAAVAGAQAPNKPRERRGAVREDGRTKRVLELEQTGGGMAAVVVD